MADYVAREWSNGDIVTAANLNNIEQGVAGVDIDLGYSCTEEWVTLTEESVTTEVPTGTVISAPQASLSYSEQIEADTIKVTFNDTVYECKRKTNSIVSYYGANLPGPASDWSQYPFVIVVEPTSNRIYRIYTQTAGTYQVKIEAFEETIETSECFEKARGYSCIESVVTTYVDEMATFA